MAGQKGDADSGVFWPDDELLSRRRLREHLIRYAFASQFVKGEAILDVACGAGYGSRHLLDKGASRVIGGDIAQPALAYAKSHYQRDGVDFILLDASRMPFRDSSFEFVVSIETIEHLEQYEQFLNECKRVLRHGGTFICSTPNKEVESPGTEKSTTPSHIKEFYPNELQSLLGRYFSNVELHGYDFVSERERGRAKITGGLAATIRDRLSWIPLIRNLLSFITRFVFREYHPTRLEDVRDFHEILGMGWEPILLQNSPLPPRFVIAVGQGSKAQAV